MKLNEALDLYAESRGLPPFEPDEHEFFVLTDEETEIILRDCGDEERMVAWTRVGVLPATGREELFAYLLRKSARPDTESLRGATLSIRGDYLFVHRIEALATLDAEAIRQLVLDFKFFVDHWSRRMLLFRPGVDRPEDLEEAKQRLAAASSAPAEEASESPLSSSEQMIFR